MRGGTLQVMEGAERLFPDGLWSGVVPPWFI